MFFVDLLRIDFVYSKYNFFGCFREFEFVIDNKNSLNLCLCDFPKETVWCFIYFFLEHQALFRDKFCCKATRNWLRFHGWWFLFHRTLNSLWHFFLWERICKLETHLAFFLSKNLWNTAQFLIISTPTHAEVPLRAFFSKTSEHFTNFWPFRRFSNVSSLSLFWIHSVSFQSRVGWCKSIHFRIQFSKRLFAMPQYRSWTNSVYVGLNNVFVLSKFSNYWVWIPTFITKLCKCSRSVEIFSVLVVRAIKKFSFLKEEWKRISFVAFLSFLIILKKWKEELL